MSVQKTSEAQLKSFRKAFDEVVKKYRIMRLTGEDLMNLVYRPEINIDELQRITTYEGQYNASSDQIKWFWEVVESFTLDEQRSLLEFATGHRVQPKDKFTIVSVPSDNKALPTSHTCIKTLNLPLYATKNELNDKLREACKVKGFGFI